jgi:hypothetical protein
MSVGVIFTLIIVGSFVLAYWLRKRQIEGLTREGYDPKTLPTFRGALLATIIGGVGSGALMVALTMWFDRQGVDQFVGHPIAQGIGFTVTLMATWPFYDGKLPKRRFGFLGSSLAMAGSFALVTALRIAFRTG